MSDTTRTSALHEQTQTQTQTQTQGLAPPLPRLVITPSTPRFPEDLFARPPPYARSSPVDVNAPSPDGAARTNTPGRPIIARSLSYDLDLASIPTTKEKRPLARPRSSSSSSGSSFSASSSRSKRSSYPSPHLLAPPAQLPSPKSGHRPLRNPIVSMLFLLLGLVLVLSSAMCGSDATAQLLTLKNGQLARISEAGRLMRWRLAVVMDLRNEEGYDGSVELIDSTYSGSTTMMGSQKPEPDTGAAAASASASSVSSTSSATADGEKVSVPCHGVTMKGTSKGMMSTEEWKAYLRSRTGQAARNAGTGAGAAAETNEQGNKEIWAGPASTIGDLWDFH